jgi:hypothetical protein
LYEDKSDQLKKLLTKEDSETATIVAKIERDWPDKQIPKYQNLNQNTKWS